MRRGKTFISGSRLSRRIQRTSNAGALRVRHVRATDARVRFPEVRSHFSHSGDSSKRRIKSRMRAKISETRRARWMDTAGDCVGRLGLKGWGMESKGFLGVGTRSWDLWFSVSVGCGRGWATTAHALNSVHSRSTGEGGEQQGARGGQSVFRRFGRGNISPSEKAVSRRCRSHVP